METIWIKNPKAIYTGTTENAEDGLVAQGNKIIELVARHQTPKA